MKEKNIVKMAINIKPNEMTIVDLKGSKLDYNNLSVREFVTLRDEASGRVISNIRELPIITSEMYHETKRYLPNLVYVSENTTLDKEYLKTLGLTVHTVQDGVLEGLPENYLLLVSSHEFYEPAYIPHKKKYVEVLNRCLLRLVTVDSNYRRK